MAMPRPAPALSNAGYTRQPIGVMSPQSMPTSPPQHMVQSMPPQQAFKGTLPPGTRVQIGSITVTVKRYLSEGGFAHVYLVTTSSPIPMPASAGSTSSSTPTTRGEYTHVLKRMAVPDKEALAEVRGEVEVHKLLRNQPYIVHFIEASATSLPNGGYEVFILMEFCAGGGIIDLMNSRLRDRLREDEVLRIFSHVCAGLSVMHHLDPPMMHRDLKVENILLAPGGSTAQSHPNSGANAAATATYKLCDFGSAAPVLSRRAPKSIDEVRRLEADLNKHTTLQYRAPEMVDPYQRRLVDEKADIWALGVLLYKLCYYTTPFEENGGGPLAILNARYRIPPSPPYSQKLKDLIGSLLQEQSTARPTIDEVLIRTHSLLGTAPPPSALHYAQQAAAGKIAKPLPTAVSGRSSDIESVRIAASRSNASPDAYDLIRLGPTEAEAAKEQAEALRKQSESITPMRRGRPPKGSGSAAVSDAAAQLQSKGEVPSAQRARSEKPAWEAFSQSTSFGKLAGSADTSVAGAAKSFDNFGFADSFQPRLSPAEASDVPSSRPLSANRNTPLYHSPALPGFNPPPSPRPSPLPSPAPPPASDSVSDRFPSVEELDAKYASPPTVRSPESVTGSSSRASFTSLAGRFERDPSTGKQPSITATSPVALTQTAVTKRWPPVGASNGSLRETKLSSESKPSFRHSIMVPSDLSANEILGQDGQYASKTSRPTLKSVSSTSLLHDADDAAVSRASSLLPPAMPPRRINRSSTLNEGTAVIEPEADTKAYRSPARFERSRIPGAVPMSGTKAISPSHKIEKGDDVSSGDESPEEADAPKRYGASTSTSARQGLPKRMAQAWEEQVHQTVVSAPLSTPATTGRVKTPAWAMSPPEAAPLPPRERKHSQSARIDTVKALYEAPPPVPASVGRAAETSPEMMSGKGIGGAERARSRAPAWDEDETTESLAVSHELRSGTEFSGVLVDVEDRKESTHLLDRIDTPEPVKAPGSRPPAENVGLKDDDDDDEEPEDPGRKPLGQQAIRSTPPPVAAPKPLRAAPARNVSVGGMLERYERIGAATSSMDSTSSAPKSFGSKEVSSDAGDFAKRFPDLSGEVGGVAQAKSAASSPNLNVHVTKAEPTAFPVEERAAHSTNAKPALPPKSIYASVVPARQTDHDSSNDAAIPAARSTETRRSETLPSSSASLSRSTGSAFRSSASKGIALKPWEREAAEAETFQKSGIVRANGRLGNSPEPPADEDLEGDDTQIRRPGVSPQQKVATNIITPSPSAAERWKLSTIRGASAQEAEARSTSVSNLISQWQASAESSAPGWGRVGGGPVGADREKERLAEGMVGVNRAAAEAAQKRESQRERLPGRDV